jgi:hypothetical protein
MNILDIDKILNDIDQKLNPQKRKKAAKIKLKTWLYLALFRSAIS